MGSQRARKHAVCISFSLHDKGKPAPLLKLTVTWETAKDEAFARLAETLILSNHQINWTHL